MPQHDLWIFPQQRRNFAQHSLYIRLPEVIVQVRFALPVFIEEKFTGMLRCFVQIVIDAPGVFSARSQEREQLVADFRFVASSGFDPCREVDKLQYRSYPACFRRDQQLVFGRLACRGSESQQ